MNKVVTVVAVLAIIFLAGILIFGSGDQEENESAVGTVYIGVTDEAVDMESVSEVRMTAVSVEFFNQSNGWIEVTSNQDQFDLLTLNENNQTKLWAEVEVPEGIYNQVRMSISEIEVEDTEGTSSQALLPSKSVTLSGDVIVSRDSASSVVLDVQADQSLHTAENGTYVFAPVIVMESRTEVEANVDTEGILTINQGAVHSAVTTGVDLNGESRSDFSVNPNTIIETGTEGLIITNNQDDDEEEEDGEEEGIDIGVETELEVEAGENLEE